jgi:hypothetical protein
MRRLRLGLEAVAASPRLAEAKVQKALLPFFAHASPQIRAAALAVVPGTKAPELTPMLRSLLQDTDPIVRASAVDALVTVGDRTSAPSILAGARTATVDVGHHLRGGSHQARARGSSRHRSPLAQLTSGSRPTRGGTGPHRA